MRGERLVTVLLLALAVAVVLWIRLLPLSLPGVTDPGVAAALRYTAGDGREHVYLGDRDSYLWLRHARNELRHGSACEAVVDGECRDTLTLAPLGGTARYAGSLHTAAIVAVHRAVTVVVPPFPLPASAYLVTVLIGVLGVFPAFALGRQLAGPIGGVVAALMVGLHPAVLQRSMGADNDIWNAVLPLASVWAVCAALAAGPRAALAYAALAAVFSSLHALVWRGWRFGFVVVLGGLAAALIVHALRWALRRRTARVWQAPAVRQTAVVACVYLACAALATVLTGAEEPAPRVIADLAGDVFASGGGADGVNLWPSALATVSELRVPTLGTIAVASYGALLFFVGWLGLLALLLPRDGWTPAHFMVWIAGNVLYRYLLTTVLDRGALLALLALPLLGAAALSVISTADDDEPDIGPALLVLTWFLAALYQSYGGLRFILLLAAPFGVGAGVAVGRLHLWLEARATRLPAAAVAPARLLVWVAALAVLLLPLRNGIATATAYQPMIDDAWVDTFERLRQTTPPDAIVNTWWDYGYWAQYYAERPVSADGATLLTHVPHWLARAQTAASEAETIGLLRMLDCASEATPLPAGRRGAFGQLVDHGLGELAAYNTVVALAGLDRAGADAHLAGLGLDPAARAAVLAATHCQPPPAHLVLSSAQANMSGWWHLGGWDPNRAYLTRVLLKGDKDAALAALSGELGYPPEEAAQMYETARGLQSDAERNLFVSPPQSLLTAAWVPCAAVEDGQRRCTVNLRDRSGAMIADVHYPAADPLRARLNISYPGAGQPTETAPGLVLVADAADLQRAPRLSTADPLRAVLIDARQHRALVGTPGAIESLYTRLMYLDGVGVSGLHKVDDRKSPRGERVVTWSIDW